MLLKGANKITVFFYLYDDIGNSALQNVQISGSSNITKSSEITGFFCRRDVILLHKIIHQLYFLPAFNSSLIHNTFGIKKYEFYIKQKVSKFLCKPAIAQSDYIT